MKTKSTLLLLCSILALHRTTSAQERITNGDFETFAGGVFSGYASIAGDGTITQSALASPFTSVYPSGTSSLFLVDGAANIGAPTLQQNFPAVTNQFSFSVDFQVSSLAVDPWFIAVLGGGQSLGALRISQSVAFNSAALLTPSPSTWYHFIASGNTSTQQFSGSITPFGGSATNFNNVAFGSNVSFLDGVFIGDFSPAKNADILIDNISVRSVPEPTTAALSMLGIVTTLRFRKQRGT